MNHWVSLWNSVYLNILAHSPHMKICVGTQKKKNIIGIKVVNENLSSKTLRVKGTVTNIQRTDKIIYTNKNCKHL